ncbi:MAG: hypothetical protein ACLTSX_00240 [Collinsella sp.]
MRVRRRACQHHQRGRPSRRPTAAASVRRQRTSRRASRWSSPASSASPRFLSDHEKQVVAYHEIGHAHRSGSSEGLAPVTKITIVPRTSRRARLPCRSRRTSAPHHQARRSWTSSPSTAAAVLRRSSSSAR